MSLKADDLLYIESSDNYVSIKYLQNKQPKAILIRNTLKNLEKEFEHSFLLRCHRSFMVNIKKVNMIKIEGPTMKIILESPGNEKIPVSRRYSNMVRNIFDSVEN
jgi:DNA-binding LytR/AlgR family response regulator